MQDFSRNNLRAASSAASASSANDSPTASPEVLRRILRLTGSSGSSVGSYRDLTQDPCQVSHPSLVSGSSDSMNPSSMNPASLPMITPPFNGPSLERLMRETMMQRMRLEQRESQRRELQREELRQKRERMQQMQQELRQKQGGLQREQQLWREQLLQHEQQQLQREVQQRQKRLRQEQQRRRRRDDQSGDRPTSAERAEVSRAVFIVLGSNLPPALRASTSRDALLLASYAVESKLHDAAPSSRAYRDPATLERRLKALATAVLIHLDRPSGRDGGVSDSCARLSAAARGSLTYCAMVLVSYATRGLKGRSDQDRDCNQSSDRTQSRSQSGSRQARQVSHEEEEKGPATKAIRAVDSAPGDSARSLKSALKKTSSRRTSAASAASSIVVSREGTTADKLHSLADLCSLWRGEEGADASSAASAPSKDEGRVAKVELGDPIMCLPFPPSA